MAPRPDPKSTNAAGSGVAAGDSVTCANKEAVSVPPGLLMVNAFTTTFQTLPFVRIEIVVPPKIFRVSRALILIVNGTVRVAVPDPIVTFSVNE